MTLSIMKSISINEGSFHEFSVKSDTIFPKTTNLFEKLNHNNHNKFVGFQSEPPGMVTDLRNQIKQKKGKLYGVTVKTDVI